jgi:hypothetical protein
MPASFWIFLIICIASFVVAIDDHSEEWKEFEERKGTKKWWKGLKVFTLWFVCVGSLIGTLVLGWESWQDSKEDAERERQYSAVTNQLATAQVQIAVQSNLLVQAQQATISASNNASNANIAVQNLNRHLTREQKLLLFNTIAPFQKGKVSFVIPQNVLDGEGLANDIFSVFQVAGWSIGHVNQPAGIVGMPDGITLNGSTADGALVGAIADVLNSFNLKTGGNANYSVCPSCDLTSSNDVEFTIMYKPEF